MKYTEEQLKTAVKNNLSIAGVLRELNIIPAGGNYRTINNKIKKLNIDISHFTGKGWNVGSRYRPITKPKSLKEILIEDSNYQANKLRKRLLKEGLKNHECECCKNKEWLGKPISLELHHVNGINTDNRIENLQILCPNCHAFTDNYRGKNINK